jgi:phage terminase Nu1 subunit (DNA packaging protein)
MVKGEGVPSKAEIARALGVSAPLITKLSKQGMPVHSIAAAQAWRIERQSVARRKRDPAHYAQGSAPAAPPSAPPATDPAYPGGMGEGAYSVPPTYNESRARREAAEAELAELRLAEERGELVRRIHVEAEAQRMGAAIKQALLNIPDRMAATLAVESDQAKVHKTLRAELWAVVDLLHKES